jgi:hypothetical protein
MFWRVYGYLFGGSIMKGFTCPSLSFRNGHWRFFPYFCGVERSVLLAAWWFSTPKGDGDYLFTSWRTLIWHCIHSFWHPVCWDILGYSWLLYRGWNQGTQWSISSVFFPRSKRNGAPTRHTRTRTPCSLACLGIINPVCWLWSTMCTCRHRNIHK